MNLELFDTRPKVKPKKLNILPENPEIKDSESAVGLGRFPSWLHRKLPKGGTLWETGKVLTNQRLHTVCEEAKCPNLLECWSKKTATFLIMGKECTRSCGFCSIDFSKSPQPLDPNEPRRVAESVKELDLKHVVITMVARDDQEDGGASHLAEVIREIRASTEETTIEILTSDFMGNEKALDVVLEAGPEIFNHNLETVRSLTPRVRHTATYDRTLSLLDYVSKNKKGTCYVKSGIMVGLGENEKEVEKTLHDLKDVGCSIVTIGQYLQPNRNKLLVKAFITPEQFKKYQIYGEEIGIPYVFAAPFVRSSYNASDVFKKINERGKNDARV